MKQLIFVAAIAALMVFSVFIHKNAIALMVGVAVGAWYFLGSVAKGGGMAELRITQDPGKLRKAGDPGSSIGMGLAAAGIAASILGNPRYIDSPQNPAALHVWFDVLFVSGLLIALVYAGKTMVSERRLRQPAGGEGTQRNQDG